MEQTENQKTTSQHIKEEITNVVDSLSFNAKKLLHKIVDKTSETGQKVNQEINELKSKAHDELDKVFRSLKEDDIEDLQPGDLVLCTLDLTDAKGKSFPKNQVFEFYPELKENKLAMKSLYFPTTRQAMKYGERKQLNAMSKLIPSTETDEKMIFAYREMKVYIYSQE